MSAPNIEVPVPEDKYVQIHLLQYGRHPTLDIDSKIPTISPQCLTVQVRPIPAPAQIDPRSVSLSHITDIYLSMFPLSPRAWVFFLTFVSPELICRAYHLPQLVGLSVVCCRLSHLNLVLQTYLRMNAVPFTPIDTNDAHTSPGGNSLQSTCSSTLAELDSLLICHLNRY